MSALTDVFTAIANAIRGKNGTQNTYTPSQMAQAITDIPSGGEGLELVACKTNASSDRTVFYFLKEDVERALDTTSPSQTVPNIAWGYTIVLSPAGDLTTFLETLATEAYVSRYVLKRSSYTDPSLFTLTDNNNNIRTDIIIVANEYIPFKVMLKKITVTVDFTVTVSRVYSRMYWWISSVSMKDGQNPHISSCDQYFTISDSMTQSTSAPRTNSTSIAKGNSSGSESRPTQTSPVSSPSSELYIFHGRVLKTTIYTEGVGYYNGTFTFDDYILT